MKAISLWQPHATWIALGWKTIETRTHERFKNLVGERIAIQAAKRADPLFPCTPFWKEDFSGPDMRRMLQRMKDEMGHILCTTLVRDALWTPSCDAEWNRRACCEVCGRFCLFLDDIKVLSDPIPFRGRQGIFEVPDELIKKAGG